MKKVERAPITEENLDQAIQQLTRLKGRYSAETVAICTASVVSFLLSLFTLVIVDLDDLGELDSVPFVKAAAVLLMEYMNKLPELWYVRLLVSLLALSIAYQLVCTVMFLLLRNMKGILILPSKPIAKARRLYKTAKVLADYELNLRAIAIAGVLVYLIIVLLGINDFAVFISENDARHSVEYFAKYFVGGAVMAFLSVVFFFFNNVINAWPRYDKDDEYASRARNLQKDLHKYWQSIDPKEAARVALAAEKERREWASRRHSSDFSSYVADLTVYQQYKSDASRSLGYGGSYTAPSSGLTDKDHDDLDAVQRAAAARGDDYHTGV